MLYIVELPFSLIEVISEVVYKTSMLVSEKKDKITKSSAKQEYEYEIDYFHKTI